MTRYSTQPRTRKNVEGHEFCHLWEVYLTNI